MRLGVVAALPRELGPTLKALGASPAHDASGSPGVSSFPIYSAASFRFAAGGIGLRRAESAALRLAEEAQGLLSVGFCGGLDDSLRPGDLILGGSYGFEASPSLLELARRARPHRVGIVHTIDHVVVDLEEKRSLVRTTGAIAVDMESEAVAKVAKNRGLPFLSVKAVVDTPAEPLASTYASVGRIALDLLLRPWRVGRMIGDGQRAKIAAEKLGDFFQAFGKELNPSEG